MIYTGFVENNIAPLNAHHIGVYDKDGNKVGIVPIDMVTEAGENPIYKFGILSDVNVSDKSRYEILLSDYKNAVEYLNSEGVNFIVLNGLYGVTCNDEKDILNNSCDIYYTNKDNKGNYTWKTNNDKFIFITNRGNERNNILEDDITYLGSELSNASEKNNTFVFVSNPFYHKAGNIYGFGKDIADKKNIISKDWDKEKYYDLNYLNNKYINSIWFTCTTRYSWDMQKYSETENMSSYDEVADELSAYNVHVPALTNPYTICPKDKIALDNWNESEGAIIEVYKNYIIVKGISFKSEGEYVNQIHPLGLFMINTSEKREQGEDNTTCCCRR